MEYILLAVTGVVLGTYTLNKTSHTGRLVCVIVMATALIALADWIAFGWFHLYSYRPGLMPEHTPDEALAELMAELLFVPGLASFLVDRMHGLWGVVIGTAVVTSLELWFLRLGILEELGWGTWMTTLGFVVYFALLNHYYQAIRTEDPTQGFRGGLLRLAVIFVVVAMFTLILRGTQWVRLNIDIMPTDIGDQSLGRFLAYVLFTVPVGYWVAGAGGRTRWIRLGVAFVSLLAFNFVLLITDLQYFVGPWNEYVDALGQTVTLWAAALAWDGILALNRRENRWVPPVWPRDNRV